MTLHELIDDALTDVPPLHLETHLRAGRRAVRRRRIASGVGGGFVLAGVFAAVWTTYGSSPSEVTPAANPGSPGATYPANPPSGAATGEPEAYPPGLPREAADFDTTTGRLVLSAGWHVVETVETPLTVPAGGEASVPAKSLGLAITDGQHEQWVLIWWNKADRSSAASWTNERGGFPSLESWLDYRVAVETQGPTDQLLSMRADGTLEPLNGVALLEQRRTPELDRRGSETAVAQVKVLNEQWYVLATRTGGTAVYYPVSYPFEGDADTLDGFVQHVAPQVAQGSYQ